MLNISQSVLNKIAKEPTIEYHLTKVLFSQDQDIIDQKLEALSYRYIPEFLICSPDYPAENLVLWCLEVLPLYLDSQAISNYINKENDLNLLRCLPYIDSPADAVDLISREITLSDKDRIILLSFFASAKERFSKIQPGMTLFVTLDKIDIESLPSVPFNFFELYNCIRRGVQYHLRLLITEENHHFYSQFPIYEEQITESIMTLIVNEKFISSDT